MLAFPFPNRALNSAAMPALPASGAVICDWSASWRRFPYEHDSGKGPRRSNPIPSRRCRPARWTAPDSSGARQGARGLDEGRRTYRRFRLRFSRCHRRVRFREDILPEPGQGHCDGEEACHHARGPKPRPASSRHGWSSAVALRRVGEELIDPDEARWRRTSRRSREVHFPGEIGGEDER